MRAALAIGRRGLGNAAPNPAVGCVVVRDDGGGPVIVGRGWTRPGGRPHAETEAIAQAGSLCAGATAYVTLEPCSHIGRTGPCADALARAGIARVVGAIRDPDPRVAGRGFRMLETYGLSVSEGLCEDEARDAHIGHIMRITRGRPSVTLKIAQSADRKASGPDGRPIRITGPDADRRVHIMRSEADGIIVGIGTALADDPALTVRLPGLGRASPVRIVFDSGLALPPTSRLAATARDLPTWILSSEDASAAAEAALRDCGVDVIRVPRERSVAGPARHRRVDPGPALRLLGARGLTRVLVEGGPTLAASLATADLVDELVTFTSPDAIGEGVDAFRPGIVSTLSARLPRRSSHVVGRDLMTILRRS